MFHRFSITVIIISTLYIVACRADIDDTICNPLNFTVRPPPPPQLAESYTARVEWKWLDTGTTVDIIDTHNGIQNTGSLDMFIEGQEVKLLYDYNEHQFITYKKGGNCDAKGLGTIEIYDNKLWLTSLHQLYSIMTQSNVAFRGEAVVRSTNTTWFQTCLYLFQFDTTVLINTYFSAYGWGMAYTRPDESIPVRVELIGNRGNETFHVIGDYTDFNPSPQIDQSIMQVPPGTFCNNRFSRKPLNILPDSFSVVFEKIDKENSKITYESIWFDAPKRLIRRDYKRADGQDADPTTEIFDFNLGIHYNMDKYMGTCDPVDVLEVGDLFVKNNGDRTLRMKTAYEYFHANTNNLQYIGVRQTRGVTCDVWVGMYVDDFAGTNFTIEWYFTQNDWLEAVGGVIQPGALFRMDIWEGKTAIPIVRNVLQYNSEAPTQDVFDVAPCFPSTQKARLLLHFAVVAGDVSTVSDRYMKDIIHTQLVTQAFLPPLRISQLSTQIVGTSDLYVEGILLDVAPRINPSIVPKPPRQHTLKASYEFLEGVVRGNWRIQLNTTVNNKGVTLESRGILQINYMTEFTTTPLPTTSTEATPPTPAAISTTVKPATQTTKYDTPPTLPLVTTRTSTSTQRTTPLGRSTTKPCKCTVPTCPTQSPTTKLVVMPSTPCPTKQCPTVTCPTVTCPSTTKSAVTIPTSSTSSTSANTASGTHQQTQNGKNNSSGLSNGATAAIALVMLVVGSFFGVVIVIVYKRIRGSIPNDQRNLLDRYLDNDNHY